MTPEKFIDKIVDAYKKAYDLPGKNSDIRVKRGKQHSISGIAEDWFALYIAGQISDKSLNFYIDTNISYAVEGVKRKKSIRPDLYILKDEVITHYFDFKTDLGWNRNFSPYLVGKNKRIQNLRGKQCKSLGKNFKFSENIKYQVVLLNGNNGGNTKEHLQTANDTECVEMYVLTTGKHPNSKDRKAVFADKSEFDRLVADTKRIF